MLKRFLTIAAGATAAFTGLCWVAGKAHQIGCRETAAKLKEEGAYNKIAGVVHDRLMDGLLHSHEPQFVALRAALARELHGARVAHLVDEHQPLQDEGVDLTEQLERFGQSMGITPLAKGEPQHHHRFTFSNTEPAPEDWSTHWNEPGAPLVGGEIGGFYSGGKGYEAKRADFDRVWGHEQGGEG